MRADNLPPQHPICTLSITLPDYTGRPSPLSTASSEQLVTLERKYQQLRGPGLFVHFIINHSPLEVFHVLASKCLFPTVLEANFAFSVTEVYKGELELDDIANRVGPDWQRLARALELPDQDIRQIRQEFPGQEALTVLRIWVTLKGKDATGLDWSS